MLVRAAWLLAMVTSMSVVASAQSFTLVGDQQGLSGRGARVVSIDASGFLWATSAGALHRWDGASMRVYRPEADDPDSLPSGQIATVLTADDGTIYVVSAIGISVYDPTRDAFVTSRPGSTTLAQARLIDKDHVLATSDREAWCFDRTAQAWKRLQGPGVGVDMDVAFDGTAYWAATRQGLMTCKVATATLSAASSSSSVTRSPIRYLRIFGGKDAWGVSDDGHVYRYRLGSSVQAWEVRVDGTDRAFIGVPRAVVVDKQGRCLIIDEADRVTVLEASSDPSRAVVGRRIIAPEGGSVPRFASLADPFAVMSDVVTDRQGDVWWRGAASLYTYAASSGIVRSVPLVTSVGTATSPEPVMICADQHGRLAVADQQNGILIRDPWRPAIRTVITHVPSSRALQLPRGITAMERTRDGRLIVGYNDGRISYAVVDPSTGAVTYHAITEGGVVPTSASGGVRAIGVTRAIESDDVGRWWMSTTMGCARISGSSVTWVDMPTGTQRDQAVPAVADIAVDRDGAVWISGYRGLWMAPSGSDAVTPVKTAAGKWTFDVTDDVPVLCLDRSGNVWGVGPRSAMRVKRGARTAEMWTLRSADGDTARLRQRGSVGILTACLADANGGLWAIGSRGLLRVDLQARTIGGVAEVNASAATLPRQGAVDDLGRLWLLTSIGVLRFEPKQLRTEVYPYEDEAGAISILGVEPVIDRSGMLTFAHTRGVAMTDLDDLRVDGPSPTLLLTSVRVRDHYIAPTVEDGALLIDVAHDENDIELAFAAPDIGGGRWTTVRYKLEGIDQRWIVDQGRHGVRYAGLAPGTYKWVAEVLLRDGTWKPMARSVIIDVRPPWWATWWFRGVVIILLIVGTWLTFKQRTRMIRRQNELLEQQVAERTAALAEARERSEKLLLNVLPAFIAERLKAGETDIADHFDNVSILFSDIVGFTPMSASQSPRATVTMLNEFFSRFDRLAREHGVERIKTMGDSYIAAAGVPEPTKDHAVRIASFALGLLDIVKAYNVEHGTDLHLRVGVNCGETIAAVVGEQKFHYDIWSDAVNVAARMESLGEMDRIQVTEAFKHEVERNAPGRFTFQERGTIDVKGKGSMRTYFLVG